MSAKGEKKGNQLLGIAHLERLIRRSMRQKSIKLEASFIRLEMRVVCCVIPILAEQLRRKEKSSDEENSKLNLFSLFAHTGSPFCQESDKRKENLINCFN